MFTIYLQYSLILANLFRKDLCAAKISSELLSNCKMLAYLPQKSFLKYCTYFCFGGCHFALGTSSLTVVENLSCRDCPQGIVPNRLYFQVGLVLTLCLQIIELFLNFYHGLQNAFSSLRLPGLGGPCSMIIAGMRHPTRICSRVALVELVKSFE